MPCPFAPLLALLPALLTIPYLILKGVNKRGQELAQRFTLDFARSASTQDARLTESGLFETRIDKQKLESFEFYSNKVPHFKKKQAHFSGRVGEAGYLLFTEGSDPIAAESATRILVDAGAAHARLQDSILKVQIKDPIAFQEIGSQNFVAKLKAL